MNVVVPLDMGPSQERLTHLLGQRSPFSAQLADLSLYERTYVGEGKAKFLGSHPANRCAFNDEWVAFIPGKYATLYLNSEGNGSLTRDTTARRGEVSQLPLTGHHLTLR
ncbi:MAG TPA: hypothetical protein VKB33_09400 [Nitrospira sp.]|nr:hypothetical protein [Nitrospira sp.]